MTGGWTTAGLIAGMAALTLVLRLAGLWLGSRRAGLTPHGPGGAALDALPPVLLAAMLAPMALASGWAAFGASLVTLLAARRWPALAVVAVGMVSIVVLRHVLPS